MKLDATDRKLLNAMQTGFPLVSRPFVAIGEELGLGEADVLERMASYREGGVLRQISAIFDTRRLGYQSILVAVRVDPARLDEVASVLNRHPGVSHNYGRTHGFNLWFTLAVHPDEDLKATVEPFGGMMAMGLWQKVIIVYPDGYCGETKITQCSDGIDNDGDGLVDSERAQVEPCRDDGSCRRRGYACREGLCCPADAQDCGLPDPDCRHDRDTGEGPTEDPPVCADGVDNDDDGLTDIAEDHGCISATWSSESNCKKGTFFVDHAVWPDGSSPGPAYEGALLDLLTHVDETYRTKRPETLLR